ncbi:MAG TPA: hypothetical protein VIE15_00850 [Acidimicrobiales bacterium]
MLSRWLSPRSVALHLAVIAWVLTCAVAAWWQVGRAEQGNAFSYMYAIEWPVFAIAGPWCWWVMLRADGHGTVGAAREARRDRSVREATQALTSRDRAEEDVDLAAYNDYLARLTADDLRGSKRR